MFEEGKLRKEKYGEKNVFDFSLGNPDLEPPVSFKKVLRELIEDDTPGLHGYMPNAGFVQTRQAVAEYLNSYNNAKFGPDEIVMSVGAGGALNVILKTILNPGEEVIIPKPYFVEYNFYLDNHQGIPRLVPTRPDFSLDIDAIENAINEKTRAVLINSPNNPTGKILSKNELKVIRDLCLDYDFFIIADEIYNFVLDFMENHVYWTKNGWMGVLRLHEELTESKKNKKDGSD